MIWMVTGLHDRRWLENVLANYARQTRADKRLIIVENGKGLGCAADCVVVLQSEPGPAQPLNAALAWLREHASPDDWFCKCDADDYYGPKYLESIQSAIEAGADYAGRCDLYIRTMAGHLWYQEQGLRGFCNGIANGPTLAARVGTALDFPIVEPWGEDTAWIQIMQQAGRRFYSLPPEGMAYQRWSNNEHTWPCTDDELIEGCTVPTFDLGPWNADIVNGTVPRLQGTLLEPVPFTGGMPLRILRESLERAATAHINV